MHFQVHHTFVVLHVRPRWNTVKPNTGVVVQKLDLFMGNVQYVATRT